MRLFIKTKEADSKAKPEQIGRIVRMDTPSLLNWMDTTIMGLGEVFDKWRYHGLPDEEVGTHLNVINAIWDEVLSRKE